MKGGAEEKKEDKAQRDTGTSGDYGREKDNLEKEEERGNEEGSQFSPHSCKHYGSSTCYKLEECPCEDKYTAPQRRSTHKSYTQTGTDRDHPCTSRPQTRLLNH